MKKVTSMIIKDGLTGEQIKLPNIELLSPQGKQAVIEAYTEEYVKNNINYYISYMYEI